MASVPLGPEVREWRFVAMFPRREFAAAPFEERYRGDFAAAYGGFCGRRVFADVGRGVVEFVGGLEEGCGVDFGGAGERACGNG